MNDYSLQIWLDHVIARDTESLGGRDNFAVMGGVIVDGAWYPFVQDPISITATMGRQSFGVNDRRIYWGSVTDRAIGLVLRAYDIDNNSAWKRERDAIKKTMATLASGVEFIPLIGSVAAKILKGWPIVVDGIVALDKNDLLLNHSTVVTLPELPYLSSSSHPVEVRFSRKDPTGYSDWDYSLHLGFGYRNEYAPSFGGTPPEHSQHPRRNSKAEEWVGSWLSAGVRCDIAPTARDLARSPGGVDLLDVRVTETGGVASIRIANGAVSITRPDDVRLLERAHSVRKADKKASIADQAIESMGRPWGPPRKKPVDAALKVPEREATGADRLMLSDDAALEIYALRDRGRETPLRVLRYVRPYSKAVSAIQVDEYLRWYPTVG